MDKRQDILGLAPEKLRLRIKELGEPAFRADQILDWIYKGVRDFDEMTNLSKASRDKFKGIFKVGSIEILEKHVSQRGDTIKYLCLLEDNNIIECVVMEYKYGNTLCLSTQVGCKMGCSFCESTQQGFIRNLLPEEMMDQVLTVNKDIGGEGKREIKNIVLMGSGEPLDNYDNVIKFLRLVHRPDTLNISYRNMTLSTCGLVPQIERLSEEDIPITLAISLHAPNDELRQRIMPIASAYGVEEIIEVAKYYFQRTKRRVSFEYALINKVNDGVDRARELGRILKGFPCHVNVIPVNEIDSASYKKSEGDKIELFVNTLKSFGIQVTKRRELGQDIGGACGQLKRGYLKS